MNAGEQRTVLVLFLIGVTKDLMRSNLRDGGIILVRGLRELTCSRRKKMVGGVAQD